MLNEIPLAHGKSTTVTRRSLPSSNVWSARLPRTYVYTLRPALALSLSVTEITQLQIVFTPGNERRLNKSKINCCNYSPAHPYNNYYTLDRGSSPLLAQITSQTHANHLSLLTVHPYIPSVTIFGFFLFFSSVQSLDDSFFKANPL